MPIVRGEIHARGEMENRIKECQLDLFADRTPATMQQLRLWFVGASASCAGFRHTLTMPPGTIRLKLLLDRSVDFAMADRAAFICNARNIGEPKTRPKSVVSTHTNAPSVITI